jgi:hypothetical protein
MKREGQEAGPICTDSKSSFLMGHTDFHPRIELRLPKITDVLFILRQPTVNIISLRNFLIKKGQQRVRGYVLWKELAKQFLSDIHVLTVDSKN